ncbi:Intradiol ring-cleavage dioxygenase [Aspergillus leporis]|uniref:Intradiol ring-cleavage dioxygenase n=1 Tax=Aspergillus leporis TaxID=41062 RepID=A0A5N5X9X8_9EURO|nr:Intradiol ring-cleavage dioxygenase [Aspergillus leporis]
MSNSDRCRSPPRVAAHLPPMLDLIIENITENFDEWEQVWQFLTKVGQISTDVRHEFVLLSDILGISALVDAISDPAVPGATESSVLGPFHGEEAHSSQYGESITSAGTPGEPTIVRGYVKDTEGNAGSKALIDVWEPDGNGVHDLEYDGQEEPNCRGKLFTDESGHYLFTCVKPVTKLKRHWYRPAHMVDHSFVLPVVKSDTVFGVKKSLIVDYNWCEDLELAKQHSIVWSQSSRHLMGKNRKGFGCYTGTFIIVKKSAPARR